MKHIPTFPWYIGLIVRLFGKKIVTYDMNCVVTTYYWRDAYYITNVRYI